MANWTDLSWFCIDTETTGVEAKRDQIVELAGVVFRQGQVVRRMGMLINPGMPIPAEATKVHGIRDEDVANCPSMQEIRERFLRHVREAQVLVGYNWPFDEAFLHASYGKQWREAIAGKPVIDALVVVRMDTVGRYWKGQARHRLDAVAERLGIAREGKAHRASSDCVLTCRVLWHLRQYLPQDADEASRLVAAERARQQKDFEAWQARKAGNGQPRAGT